MRVLKICMAILLLTIVAISVKLLPEAKETSGDKLESYCVIVDAGHGGKDPGKVGVNGELEKDINLEISYALKTELEAMGVEVLLTRTDDNGLYSETDTNKKAADMKKRCEVISQSNADVVISIHQNSYTDESVNGTQVFYYKHSEDGKKLATDISKQVVSNMENNNRPVKANDSYYMLIHTPCPTVIVECGFLSNYTEAENLCDEEYQKRLAKALSLGVLDFLKSND